MKANARFRLLAVAAASALIFTGNAIAEKPADKGKKQRPRQVLDTGVELVPVNPAGDAALDAMTNRSSDGLTMVYHGNGMVSVDLEGRFMSVMMVTQNADHTHTLACLTGEEARKHLAAGEQTAKAWNFRKSGPAPARLEEK